MIKYASWFIRFLILQIAFHSGTALAFPELFRLGYHSCSSCHVSPSGSGVLTDYGKSIASEISTLNWEGSGRSDYGLFQKLPESWQNWFDVGGDSRYIEFQRDKTFQKFAMQRELEGAVHLNSRMSVVASVGLFGPNGEKAYRKQYILYKFNENIRIRLGKFTPAYGILQPDHTIITRRGLGFDALKETYNGEWSFTSGLGEVFITGSMGQHFDLEGGQERGLQASSEDERATFVRWALYAGDNLQFGASYKFGRLGHDLSRMWGLFAMFSPWPQFYALTEGDYKVEGENRDQKAHVVSYSKLGYEPYRGFHLYYAHEWVGVESAHSYGVQWFPLSHFEFNFTYKVDQLVNSWVLMSHYYL